MIDELEGFDDSNDPGIPSSELEALFRDEPTVKDQQLQSLQKHLSEEQDARREERFVFIVVVIALLDVVFFSVMESFGGPLALLILELFILIPLARKMGMEEIAAMLDRLVSRIAGSNMSNEP